MSIYDKEIDAQKTQVLAVLRKEAGLNQGEVAKYFNLNRYDSVSVWERGKWPPHRKKRVRFINYLLDKLGLRKKPERFLQLWTDVMVGEWKWDPLQTGELPHHLQIIKQNIEAAARGETTLESSTLILPTSDAPILAPGPLPQGSRMPLGANPIFVGRSDELRAIIAAFQKGNTVAIGQTVAATGIGGIGKTQLAVEFAHRYGRYFPGGVFWLSFAKAEEVPREVARCGGIEGLALRSDFDKLKLNAQVQLVQRKWREPIPRLLIFDNCEDESLLGQWRPPHGGCRILVTSRRGRWDAALGLAQIEIDVLPRAESITLLRHFLQRLTREEANAISEELGDLPLALRLAGKHLADYQHDIQPVEYLAQLRELRGKNPLSHPSLRGLGVNFSPTGHELHIARTFALSYERLDSTNTQDAIAQDLLARIACFAPGELIPRKLLRLTIKSELPQEKYILLVADGLNRLITLGLIDAEGSGELRLHRLIAAFAKILKGASHAQADVEKAISKEAERLNETHNPALLQAWEVHLRHITSVAYERADEQTADLCNALGYHLQMIGDYAGARRYYEQTLAIDKATVGLKHENTATSLNNLGLLCHDEGKMDEALWYHKQALAIRQQVLDPSHRDTINLYGNLAVLLKDMGNYIQVQHYYERVLAIHKQNLKPNHPHLAIAYNNLGRFLQTIGKLDEAYPHLERALHIREQTLGLEHSYIAQSLNNMGLLLHEMKDFNNAYSHLQRALAMGEQMLGSKHPDIAATLNNLGRLFIDMGKLDEARQHLKRALDIRKQKLRPDHPHMAVSLNSWGWLLKEMGNLDDAHHYIKQALNIRQAKLNTGHREIADNYFDLGQLLQVMGNNTEAVTVGQKSLAIFKKIGHYKVTEVEEWLNFLKRGEGSGLEDC